LLLLKPTYEEEVQVLKNRVSFAIGFLILGFLAVIVYIYRVKVVRIVTPFILALVIYYVLNPVVNLLQKHGIKKNAAILLIFLFIVLTGTATFIYIYPEMIRSIEELNGIIPDIAEGYQQVVNRVMSSVKYSKWSDSIKDMIFREMENFTAILQRYITNLLQKTADMLIDTVSLLVSIVLAMVISYYFITDSSFFYSLFMSVVPVKWRNWLRETGRQIDSVITRFVQGQLLIALILGLIEFTGFYIIGVKFALLLGIIGAICNIIPYFGPVIGAVPAVILSFLQSPYKAIWVIVLVIIAQQFENAVIEPRVIEGKLGFHPVTTIFLVMAGGEFFGIMGMLFAIPVAAVLKVIAKRIMSII